MKKEKEIAICRDCGKKIQGESVEIDGEYVCQECFDEYYFYCDDCCCIEEKDNGYYVDSCDRFVCQNCLDNNYFKCEDCGNYYSYDDYYYLIHTDRYDNYYVCDSCYNRGEYSYCDGCGNYFESDCCHWHNDYCYCDNCYDYSDELLYDYHEFDDWYFYRGTNEENVPYYIGKEIELEPKGYSNVSEVLEIINNNINAVGMEDGSLSSGGVEVVTHPESWKYLQEHKENYKNFFRQIENINYGDDGCAGLHFHVSRPNENVVSRVMILIESFKDEIKKLSRRHGDFHWAHFLSDGCSEKSEQLKYQSSKYLKEEYLKTGHDRYYALNLQNSSTIEFRFFNGANNFEEFWGALQFIHNIMDIALDEDRDINTIEWNDLIYGEELIEQAKKQEVYQVEKHAQDTTEILEKIEELVENTKETIKKTLSNLIKYINKEIINIDLTNYKSNDIKDIENNAITLASDIANSTRYLGNVINLYNTIDNYTINGVKNNIDYYKNDKYTRYFKQIEKTIKKYESEVAA